MKRKLTRRVVEEVFHGLLEGKSYRKIARSTGIGVSTVHYLKEVLDYAIDNASTIMYRLREYKKLSSERRKYIDTSSLLARASADILYSYYLYIGWRIVKEIREEVKKNNTHRDKVIVKIRKRVNSIMYRFIDALIQFTPLSKSRLKQARTTDRNFGEIALEPLYELLDKLELLFRSEIENKGFVSEVQEGKSRIALIYVVDGNSLGYSYNLQIKIPLTYEILVDPVKTLESIHYCAEKLFNENTASKILSIIEEYMSEYYRISQQKSVDPQLAIEEIHLARKKTKRRIRKIIEDRIGKEIISTMYIKTPDQLSNMNRVNILIYLRIIQQ